MIFYDHLLSCRPVLVTAAAPQAQAAATFDLPLIPDHYFHYARRPSRNGPTVLSKLPQKLQRNSDVHIG